MQVKRRRRYTIVFNYTLQSRVQIAFPWEFSEVRVQWSQEYLAEFPPQLRSWERHPRWGGTTRAEKQISQVDNPQNPFKN